MNRALLIAEYATALLIAPCYAQVQDTATQNELSQPEFRQVLIDLGSYLDAHKGTDLLKQFEAIPDSTLSQIYPAVANPRQLQAAVRALRAEDAVKAAGAKRLATRTPVPDAGVYLGGCSSSGGCTCPAGVIIDDAAGSICVPAYPASNNPDWQNLVKPLIADGAFSAPYGFSDVFPRACDLGYESHLSQVASNLQGTILAVSAVCNAVPLGASFCWAADAAFSLGAAASIERFSDCQEQDRLVNAAETDAGFHNTVTIFNALGNGFTTLGTQVTTDFTALSTQLTGVSTQITGGFAALDTHLSNVDNHIATAFAALSAQIVQATALLNAELNQVMKLQLTPDGLKAINPAILTCTGTNCPAVLAKCPATGCSWNNAGPLP